jgi:hypothetical protein
MATNDYADDLTAAVLLYPRNNPSQRDLKAAYRGCGRASVSSPSLAAETG